MIVRFLDRPARWRHSYMIANRAARVWKDAMAWKSNLYSRFFLFSFNLLCKEKRLTREEACSGVLQNINLGEIHLVLSHQWLKEGVLICEWDIFLSKRKCLSYLWVFIIMIRYMSHTIFHFNYLKRCSSVALRTFTLLCSYHHHICPELSHPPN